MSAMATIDVALFTEPLSWARILSSHHYQSFDWGAHPVDVSRENSDDVERRQAARMPGAVWREC